MLLQREAGGKEQSQPSDAHNVCLPTIDTMSQDAEYVKYINEHIIWMVENTIGYQEQLVPKVTSNCELGE